mmetsp:Transcript_16004/g.16188  ORF Transcript_16004/g.16188 Transcript_16004/m.16188 type:complete len:85 (-) Transcript_16004:454-708(-)
MFTTMGRSMQKLRMEKRMVTVDDAKQDPPSVRTGFERTKSKKIEGHANIWGVYVTPIKYVYDDWRTRDDLNVRCRLMEEIARQI